MGWHSGSHLEVASSKPSTSLSMEWFAHRRLALCFHAMAPRIDNLDQDAKALGCLSENGTDNLLVECKVLPSWNCSVAEHFLKTGETNIVALDWTTIWTLFAASE
jgi:hypothetical protein